MYGIIDINTLLKEMKPVLDETKYVFTTKECFELTEEIVKLKPIATFLEKEGMTLVISQEQADIHHFTYGVVLQKITLEVHSSLEAVGLTAAISAALTKKNISANVIAGHYHDHVFVPYHQAQLALQTLEEFTK